ncbi:Mitochondrial translation elongation factor EF-Ts [Klebsormidium nitens]|uniref:Elongation factor Ts, mitochondrial n=1 Tax=Klebsormidium nitens TaxID=105231 RepID=A0A1Y1I097_KLENI|nr:Mitochondrial translation elongation factor EF-Ts [Klebsormidium nitens]|eukprot:GAQ84335.1 Mitochondrial translation elongation factor EF-Ts [Klebsormidium nitens]
MASVTTVSGVTHACVSLCSAQAHSNVSARQRIPKPAALSKCQLLRPCRPSVKLLSGVRLSSGSPFSRSGRSFTTSVSATVAEGETVVEEATAEDEIVAEEDADAAPEPAAPDAEGGEAKPAARRPFKNRRKITVKIEDLQPGQTVPGKVRSIQSYGCFVDIGAFTDGLIHISELADQFVENVGDLVEAGQEVQARILEVDVAKGRISLSMRTPREERPEPAEGAGAPRAERGAGPRPQRGGDQRPRRAVAGGRGGSDKPSHGIRKGQKFEGTVTSIAPFGAFLELKDGVEGLLHASEIGEGSERVEVAEHLEMGQKVNVTVLSVTKDRISLTTKERVDTDDINVKLNQGAEFGTDGITNPFEAAFKKSNLVLDKLPGAEELAKTKKPEPVAAASDEIKTETQEIQKAGLFSGKKVDDAPAPAAEKPEEADADDSSNAGAAEAVQETVEDVVDDAKDAAQAVTEGVEPIADEVADVAKPVVEKAEEVAEPVAEKVEEVVEPVAEKVEEVVEPAAEKVKEAAEPVIEKVEEVVEPVAEKVEEAAEPVIEKVEEVVEPVAEKVKEAAEPVIEKVEEVVEPVAEKVEEVAEPVIEKVKEVAEPVIEKVEEVAEPVAEKVEPIVEEVKETVTNAADTVGEKAEPLVENAKETVTEAVEPVAEKVEPAVEEAKETVTGASDNVGDQLGAIQTGGIGDVVGPVAEAVENVVDSVKEAAEPVVEKVEEVIESVKDAVAPAAEETKEAAPAVEAAKEDAPSLAEQVKEAADAGVAAVTGVVDQVTSATEEAPAAKEEKPKEAGGISAVLVKALREETGSGMMDCKKALAEANGDIDQARDILRKKGLASADKKSARVAAEGAIGSYIHDSRIGVLLELNCETDFVSRGDTFKELLEDLAMQVAACPQVEFVSVDEVPADVVAKEREIEAGKEDLASKPEAIREKMVDGRINKRLGELALLEQPFIKDDKLKVKDLIKATVAKIGENIQIRRFERYNLGEGLTKKTSNLAAEVAEQTQKKEAAPAPAPAAEEKKEEAPAEAKPAVAVSASAVKELRAETGAGMMDCKKALAECDNDVEKARELLRKKGLASAEKKSSRLAAEGAIGSYIHDGRIGVLVEVNCETDFVARGDKFKELLEDVAMQVAACPQVTVVSPDDVPAEIVAKEREIELGKEDLASKPEAIREKIVDGRMAKRVNELALLEQPYIRDDKQKLRDVIQAAVATIGENIQVRRFVRFNLGEGIEKKSVDFAAEVAAQTGKA